MTPELAAELGVIDEVMNLQDRKALMAAANGKKN
jgi:hypothetical protein